MGTRYSAIAEWSRDGWWAVHIDAQPGVWTQARRLEQVPGTAADALSLALDTKVLPSDIEVEAVPPAASAGQALEAKEAAEAAAAESSRLMRTAIRDLSDAGLSVRDMGRVLNMSHQRAAVLAKDSQLRRRLRNASVVRANASTGRIAASSPKRITAGGQAAKSR